MFFNGLSINHHAFDPRTSPGIDERIIARQSHGVRYDACESSLRPKQLTAQARFNRIQGEEYAFNVVNPRNHP